MGHVSWLQCDHKSQWHPQLTQFWALWSLSMSPIEQERCTNTNIMGVTEDGLTKNNILSACLMITIYSHNGQPCTVMKDQICSLKQRGDRPSMGIDKSWSLNGDYLFNQAQLQASQATMWMSWHIKHQRWSWKKEILLEYSIVHKMIQCQVKFLWKLFSEENSSKTDQFPKKRKVPSHLLR